MNNLRIKLDQDTLGLSTLVEQMTGAQVKDCFKEEDFIYVIVGSGEAGKAIGKGGDNIHRLQETLGKRDRIIEYADQPKEFVRKIIYPLEVEEILTQDNLLLLKDRNKKTKSLLIGRNGQNLKLINRAVQRFFTLEVKVV